MATEQLEKRKVARSLGVVTVEPMIWKPALLKVLGGGMPDGTFPRRRLDRWIAEGKFPPPDGVKFEHPWWYVSTVEAWRKSP